MSEKEPALCYISGEWAFFTTQSLDKQWGDDWNDAPYEHNAGEPYGYRAEFDNNKEPWEIVRVAWRGPFETPADVAGCNSAYSVEDINRGAVAWLLPSRWTTSNGARPIVAGTSLSAFVAAVKAAGGSVYTEA